MNLGLLDRQFSVVVAGTTSISITQSDTPASTPGNVSYAHVAAGGYAIGERLDMAGSDPNQASDQRSAVADKPSSSLRRLATAVYRRDEVSPAQKGFYPQPTQYLNERQTRGLMPGIHLAFECVTAVGGQGSHFGDPG